MNKKAKGIISVTEVMNEKLIETFPDWYLDNVFHDMADALITGKHFEKQLQFIGKEVKIMVDSPLFEVFALVTVRLYDSKAKNRIYSSKVWKPGVEQAKCKPEYALQIVSVIMCGLVKEGLLGLLAWDDWEIFDEEGRH